MNFADKIEDRAFEAKDSRMLRYAAAERRAAFQLREIVETRKLQVRRAYAAIVEEMMG